MRSVAFSPDGKTVAAGGLSEVVKLWEVATGKVRASFGGHTDVSGDGGAHRAEREGERRPESQLQWGHGIARIGGADEGVEDEDHYRQHDRQ